MLKIETNARLTLGPVTPLAVDGAWIFGERLLQTEPGRRCSRVDDFSALRCFDAAPVVVYDSSRTLRRKRIVDPFQPRQKLASKFPEPPHSLSPCSKTCIALFTWNAELRRHWKLVSKGRESY